jgi:hypothetical protein
MKGGRKDEVVMDENDLMLSGGGDVCDWHHPKSLCGIFTIGGHFHFNF